MLHRAASNAYSWWWASHIRTKQSKWLEENLQDMEDKVNDMLKIIENEGNTFAERAEMYYRKRPELINQVEDAYRSYRALAERYDHLSKELQSANRTVAAVFPERVQYMDDEDFEQNDPPTSTYSDDYDKVVKANIPKVPRLPKNEFRSQSTLLSRRGQLNKSASSAKAAMAQSSGLSREEALQDIDKLQKEILALQTEREFIQSVHERCQAKCSNIDDQITEIQAKVSNLQDEFDIGKVIDDDEARTLMAASALKSCQETLDELQEKQEQSVEEVEVENQRVKEVHQRITTLKSELLTNQTDPEESTKEQETDAEKIDQPNLDLQQEKIMNELNVESSSSLTVMQLADNIDELVEKVANLETAVSSQGALVNRLRSETDGLQALVKTLEEDKETLMENSENTNKKLMELEEELHRVKYLHRSFKGQNSNLQMHFTDARCNFNHLSMKLQTVKPDEEDVNARSIEGESAAQDDEAANGAEEHAANLPAGNHTSNALGMGKAENKDVPVNSNHVKVEESVTSQMSGKSTETTQDKMCLFEMGINLDTDGEELVTDAAEDQPNWRQVFISGLEDREKLLVEEYSLVLKNYKDVRKKLSDVEKKNRDGFFELALQIRELKNALARRDEEIQSLRKMSSTRKDQDENHGSDMTKYKYPHQEGSPESTTQAPSFLDSNVSYRSSPLQQVLDSVNEHHTESTERIDELSGPGDLKAYPSKEVRNEMKAKHAYLPRPVSAIEEKFRSDIDELLEENLEFWLRFSTSLHQTRKFQTSVHDLKVELSKLKDHVIQSGNSRSLGSEVRPIYKHLREIQTDLTLWLENNSVLKDELRARFASLCNIQEELSRISHVSSKAEEAELSEYQAAKFQGELLNMKQESNKVSDELQSGLDRVKGLNVEVEKILANLDEELGISSSKPRSSTFRSRIPLRSFLFGVKLKKHKQQKQSFFSCVSPALHKQNSDMAAAP